MFATTDDVGTRRENPITDLTDPLITVARRTGPIGHYVRARNVFRVKSERSRVDP